ALTVITPDNLYLVRATGFWEYNLYIGAAGLLFLLLFGVWPLLQRQRVLPHPLRQLALPLLLLTLLSLCSIYQSVAEFSDIAIFRIERVPARFLILPFTYLLLVATLQFNRWLRTRALTAPVVIASLATLLYGSERLLFNARVWRLCA